jgi:hypothetical protein
LLRKEAEDVRKASAMDQLRDVQKCCHGSLMEDTKKEVVLGDREIVIV